MSYTFNKRPKSDGANLLVTILLSLGLIWLCITGLIAVSQALEDTSSELPEYVASQAPQSFTGKIRYRFRRIYTGAELSRTPSGHALTPDVKSLPAYGTAGTVRAFQPMATPSAHASASAGGIRTSLSVASSSASGAAFTKMSSSATMSSYGGGASYAHATSGHSSTSHVSSVGAPTAYASVSAPSHISFSSFQGARAVRPANHLSTDAGPQKAGEYIWDGTLYNENDEVIGTVDGSGNVWNGGVIIGTYSGGFYTQGEAVDNPIGAPWILLLFAAAFALLTYIRKNNLSFQSMKHSSLKILTFLSFLTLALPQAWGTTNKFVNGTTIYINATSPSGWASDNATIGAIFYYQDNDSWCIETANDTYSDSNIELSLIHI